MREREVTADWTSASRRMASRGLIGFQKGFRRSCSASLPAGTRKLMFRDAPVRAPAYTDDGYGPVMGFLEFPIDCAASGRPLRAAAGEQLRARGRRVALQPVLAKLRGRCVPGADGRPSFPVALVPEPDNPYDPHAVAVVSGVVSGG